MNMQLQLRICVLATALIFVAIALCPAQENHSAAPAAEQGHSPPNSEEHVPGGSELPPHWKRDHAINVRTGGVTAPRNLLAPRLPAPNTAVVMHRNAIGVPIRREEPGQSTDGHGVSGFALPSVSAANKSPAGLQAGMDRRFPEPHPQMATAQRGSISGTGMARHAFAPAVIGGPANSSNGIGGASFRSKRAGQP